MVRILFKWTIIYCMSAVSSTVLSYRIVMLNKPAPNPLTCMLNHFSHVWLFVTLWTGALQGPLSMEFSRQELNTGVSCHALFQGIFLTRDSCVSWLPQNVCHLDHSRDSTGGDMWVGLRKGIVLNSKLWSQNRSALSTYYRFKAVLVTMGRDMIVLPMVINTAHSPTSCWN